MHKFTKFFNLRAVVTSALGALAATLALGAAAQSNFEAPAEGKSISGLALFSGWVCEAESVQIEFLLNGAVLDAAYGTDRGDTESVCGDTNNGFSLLFNFGNFPTGEQTVKLLVDGEEVATRTFNTIQLSQGAFVTFDETDLETVTTSTTLTDFPKAGHSVVLSWDQASQNFVIASESIPVTGGSDVLQDGVADAQYDVGIFAFDQAINYAACGGTQDFASAECPSISFSVVDDEDRGAVLEVEYLTTDFAGIVIDSSSPGIDMSAYESGLLNFDIKVVSAGSNSIYKVKLDDHNGGSTGEYDVTAANSGDWETFSVNMADLLVNVDGNNVGGNMSLSSLKAVVFMATFGKTEDVVFRIDNVYFQQ
jgi:hypothetical protein